MSTIADHDYMPEEHAPDPILGHGDQTAPGKIGIWLFLASEVMFFIGVLGSYIILRAGSHEMFSRMAQVLSKPLAGLNTLVLILSSLTMALSVEASQKGDRKKTVLLLLVTFLCACGFMVIKTIEYRAKWVHNTIVATDPAAPGKVFVYDGDVDTNDVTAPIVHLTGFRAEIPLGTAFDIHLIAPSDVKAMGKIADNAEETEYTLKRENISDRTQYFPWKNMFFACYFTLTGIHGVHVLGGMVPIFILMVQAMRGKLFPHQTEYVGLYWHFVDLVWIFLFPLLYLI